MLFDSYSPFMNLFNQINSHLSQSSHISKYAADCLNRFFNRFININHWVSLHFYPVNISSIFFCLLKIFLRKKCKEFSWFSNISPYLIQTSLSRFNSIINHMQKTSILEKSFVLLLQFWLYFRKRQTFPWTEKGL